MPVTTADAGIDVSFNPVPDFPWKTISAVIQTLTNTSDGWEAIWAWKPTEIAGVILGAPRFFCSDIGTSLELDLFSVDVGNGQITGGSSLLTGTVTLTGDKTPGLGTLADDPTIIPAGTTVYLKQIAAVGTNTLLNIQIPYRPLLGHERGTP